MKLRYALLLALCFFFYGSQGMAQSICSFPLEWRFQPYDSTMFSQAEFNDSHWKTIQVPASWESQGFGQLDGFAWYRCRVECGKIKKGTKYFLLLGKIDDADETYVNGVRVGSAGTFPPNSSSEWNTQRIYPLPENVLKTRNIIAVRVFDSGGPGGIQKGIFGIFSEREIKKMFAPKSSPGKSFFSLTTSNGLIAAVYNETDARVEAVYPHIFKDVDANRTVKPFLQNISLGKDFSAAAARYESNTHVIRVAGKSGTVYLFAPFTYSVPVFVIAGEFRKGKPFGVPSFKRQENSVLIDSVSVSKSNLQRTYYFFSFDDSLRDNHAAICSMKSYIRAGNDLVAEEVANMRKVIAGCKLPKTGGKEKSVLEQSIAFLKMAQVSQSEVYPKGRGGVVASLPPGNWNITWLRDGCYTLLAMTKLGLHEEAKNLIRFFLDADAGYYRKYIYTDGVDYGIGQDYQLSVCRYYGSGKEESDFNENGPNIEIDGFGLFLYAFADYIRQSGDTALYREYRKMIKQKIADVLLTTISGNGLIRKESGPWERHLPGKQITYTTITAAKGLHEYAELLRQFGVTDSTKYDAGAAALLAALDRLLVDDSGAVKGTLEALSTDAHEYFDAATYELFNFFPERYSALFDSHHRAYRRFLQISPSRGFRRVNNGDWYDKQEWIILNCRIANALAKYGKKKESRMLRDWVTNQSALNNNQVAELYAENSAGYEGAVPMIGFGAAAYILMILADL